MNNNSWKISAKKILLGIAFSFFNIDIPVVGMILNTAGFILLFLGSRALRKDNKAFLLVYMISVIGLFKHIVSIILKATYLNIIDLPNTLFFSCSAIGVVLLFILLCSFTIGVSASMTKAGHTGHRKGLYALIIWFFTLSIWVALGLNVALGFLNWLILIAFVLIIVRIYKTIDEVDTADYSAAYSPVKISDLQFTVCFIVILVTIIVIGNTFFCKLPEDWKAKQAETSYNSDIAKNLVELGFPERVLMDMSDEDIIKCSGADKVTVSSAVNGSSFSGYDESGFKIGGDGSFNVAQIAVRIPGNENNVWDKWYIIDYFYWPGENSFPGNEVIDLGQDTFFAYGQWTFFEKTEGKILYDSSDMTHIADIKYFSKYINLMFNENKHMLLSFPKTAVNARGYVIRQAEGLKNVNFNLSVPFIYYHQISSINYPLKTPFSKGYSLFKSDYQSFRNSFQITLSK